MADDRLDDAIDAVVRAVDRIERATRGIADAAPAVPPVAPPVPPAAPAAPVAPPLAEGAYAVPPEEAPAPLAGEPVADSPTLPLPPPTPPTFPEQLAPAPPAPPVPAAPPRRTPTGPPDMSANTGSFWLPRPDGVEPVELKSGFSDDAPPHPTDQPFTTHEIHDLTGPTQQQPEQPYDVTSTSSHGGTTYAPDPSTAERTPDSPTIPLPPPALPDAPPADASADASAASAPRAPDPQTTAEFSALGAAALRPFAEHAGSPEVHELVGRIVGRTQSLDDHLEAASHLRVEINELVARLAAAAVKPH